MENQAFYKSLREICDDDREFEAIAELLKVAEKKYVQAAKDVVEASAKLYYISKLNSAKHHDEAIAALCE